MFKKVVALCLLIALLVLSTLSVSANTSATLSGMQPEQVVLFDISDKIEKRYINTYGDKQDVEINVSNDLESMDLVQATSLVVKHECYEGMSKSGKRVLNQMLKEEIDNKKEIIFLGEHSTLDPTELSANLDLDMVATVEDLSTDSNVFAISFGKDIYDNDVLSFYRADCEVDSEEALSLLAEVITSSFENSSDDEYVDPNLITTQELSSSARDKAQKIIDYKVYKNGSNNAQVVVRSVIDAKRVDIINRYNNNTKTTWEVKMHLDINPLSGYTVRGAIARMYPGNINDEERLKSWPTTTVGSGSQGFSFGAGVGCSGGNASAGYTYSVEFSDITCATQIVDGDINDYHWTFSYANGSNVSKYSSALELGSRYNNKKGKFTLYTESYVLSRQSGEGGTIYRIALEDISTAK